MAGISSEIKRVLQGIDLKSPSLSTLAQKGDDQLVQEFLSENIKLGNASKETIQSQLYIASFWGLIEVVKTLLENSAEVNFQNPKSRWTPLHAATFQEHGKVVMHLLEKHADPNIEDFEGRTPCDFGSASDMMWPFFAAVGCQRTTKVDLIKKGVLRPFAGAVGTDKVAKDAASMRCGNIVVNFNTANQESSENDRKMYSASVDGDVLAIDDASNPPQAARSQKPSSQPSFSAWRN